MDDTAINTNSNKFSTLGDRMKAYEEVTEIQLCSNLPAILRLDGHKFSSFTRGFDRPFDVRLHNAMVETCKDLLKNFPSCTFVYTQSDEITMIFPNGVICFNDRVQKVASLAAGLASARFNAHLTTELSLRPEPHVPPGKIGWAYFDARLFNVPDIAECLNNLIWRCKFDCVRNGISACARQYFTTKELHKKEKATLVEMLREKGVDYFKEVPIWGQEGTMIKKELLSLTGTNKKSSESVNVLRTQMRAVDGGVLSFSTRNMSLIADKYWATEVDTTKNQVAHSMVEAQEHHRVL